MLFRPDLLSVLAQQLQSADVLASHRVFMVLFRTLKELSTKRLAVDQKNYAEVTSFCIVETHLSVCIAAQMCLCFIQCFFFGGGGGGLVSQFLLQLSLGMSNPFFERIKASQQISRVDLL
jgi:hypothetical protein